MKYPNLPWYGAAAANKMMRSALSVRRLPPWARPSLAVDLAQLLTGLRPAIRTEIPTQVAPWIVRSWARRHGCYLVLDRDGFAVLSHKGVLARRIMTVDRELSDHTVALGRMLGYPLCCSRKAGEIGELGLDAWAASRSQSCFIGRFRYINPQKYHQGAAWISHIPCSPHCIASVRRAHLLARKLRHPLSRRHRLSHPLE